MAAKKRLFLILWLMGLAGILSFLLIDLSALIAAMPLPPDSTVPDLPPMVLKLLGLIQPTVLTSIAVLVGIRLAPSVDLHAPAAEAFAERRPVMPALLPQIFPGAVAGIACGALIVLTWLIAKPFLSAEFIARSERFNQLIPFPLRVLYGGFTEEILLRWGLMTFLVWLLWRIIQRGEGAPRSIFFLVAIVGSALVFGAGHLPLASLLAGGLTAPVAIYVLTANSIFGIVAGFLYWRRGLEAAMLAHIFAHLVLIIAIFFAV